MSRFDRLAENLPNFLDELRSAGYVIGLEQYVAAADLLLSLAARDALPSDPRRLVTFLGPIVCKAPGDQDDFRARFERWVDGLDRPTGPPQPRPAAEDGPGEERRTGSPTARVVVRALTMTAVASVFIGTVAWLGQGSSARRGPTGPGDVTTPKVVPDAPVALLETGGIQPDAAAKRPEAQQKPSRANRSGGVTDRVVAWGRRGAVALLPIGIAGLVVWKLWWFVRVRRYLVRRPVGSQAEIWKVCVKGVRGGLFPRPVVSRAARDLRRRRPVESRQFDIKATVDRVARQAGRFTPVAGRRRLAHEHLVLVDRTSFNDHQARLNDELIGQLEDDGVAVTAFHFDGDPRGCYPARARAGSPPLAPRDLSARHPESRLIVFADASVFIDPVTGEPFEWAGLFGAWPGRALLTPEPVGLWSQNERILASVGWIVLPATAEGLVVLATHLNDDIPEPLSAARHSPRLPEALTREPLRWIDRRPPPPPEFEDLLAGLRGYLGPDGFAWLAACAVYPEIHWDVTISLGAYLRDRAGRSLLDGDRLAALARLPWFRYGTMPDWLRARLSGELSVSHERATRDALVTLFLSALESPEGGATLEIAEGRARGGLLAARVFARFVSAEPPDSPLRERVFASFMSARLPRRLTVALPRAVAATLFSTGRPRRPARLRTSRTWRGFRPFGRASKRRPRSLITRPLGLAIAGVTLVAFLAAVTFLNRAWLPRDVTSARQSANSSGEVAGPGSPPSSGSTAPTQPIAAKKADPLAAPVAEVKGPSEPTAKQTKSVATSKPVEGAKSEVETAGPAPAPPLKPESRPESAPAQLKGTIPDQIPPLFAKNAPKAETKPSEPLKSPAVPKDVQDRINEAWDAIAAMILTAQDAGLVKTSIDPPPVLDILIDGKADDETVLLAGVGKPNGPTVAVSPEVFGAWFTGYGKTPGVVAVDQVRITPPSAGLKEWYDRRAQLLTSHIEAVKNVGDRQPNLIKTPMDASRDRAWSAVARAVVAAQNAGLVKTSIDPPPVLDILIDGKADDETVLLAGVGKPNGPTAGVSPEVFAAWFTGYGKIPGVDFAKDVRMMLPKAGLQTYYDRRAALLRARLKPAEPDKVLKTESTKENQKGTYRVRLMRFGSRPGGRTVGLTSERERTPAMPSHRPEDPGRPRILRPCEPEWTTIDARAMH